MKQYHNIWLSIWLLQIACIRDINQTYMFIFVDLSRKRNSEDLLFMITFRYDLFWTMFCIFPSVLIAGRWQVRVCLLQPIIQSYLNSTLGFIKEWGHFGFRGDKLSGIVMMTGMVAAVATCWNDCHWGNAQVCSAREVGSLKKCSLCLCVISLPKAGPYGAVWRRLNDLAHEWRLLCVTL